MQRAFDLRHRWRHVVICSITPHSAHAAPAQRSAAHTRPTLLATPQCSTVHRLHTAAAQHSHALPRRAERSAAPLSSAEQSTPDPSVRRPSSASASHSYADTLHLPQSTFTAHFNASKREPELAAICCRALYRHQQQQPLLQPDLTYSASPPLFVLHDGPPFANGRLHLGHFLNRTLKDIVNRHALMTGHRVHYVCGWDCHGLPIELKALAAATTMPSSSSSRPMSPLDIRRTARAFALSAIAEQRAEFERWGVLTDWQRTYRTMDADYEADQLLVLLAMMQRGLIYRALKPVHWSPATHTALAEAELEYRDDHCSTEVYCLFPVVEGELRAQHGSDVSVMIWTTTPWTLPGNVAIAYHPDVEYVVVEPASSAQGTTAPRRFVVAKERIPALQTRLPSLRIVSPVSASVLASTVCSHPFIDRRSPLISAAHVTTDIGTGLVHTAPAHGADDFVACQEHGLHDIISLVDEDGRYTDDAPPALRGRSVLSEGNAAVLSLLTATSSLLISAPFTHRYPYDWRSKTPVITRATTQWFARLDSLQADALRETDKVRFTPGGGKVRLRAMIGGRKEWCLSRQRVWGVPIPVFYRDDGHVLMTEESVRWVAELVRQHGSEVWWEKDEAELLAPPYRHDGHTYRKGTDTLDVWFDSGSSWMPALRDVQRTHGGDMRQLDVYLEGSDQHRGWFQSSLLTSVAVNGCAPFRTIVTHGFVLDPEGRKMSKSLGNVIDPSCIIDGPSIAEALRPRPSPASAVPKEAKKPKQPAATLDASSAPPAHGPGADFLRLWVSSIDYTTDASISKSSLLKVGEMQRKIRNVARFMLGCLSSWTGAERLPLRDLYGVDRYMLHVLEQWAQDVDVEYREGRYSRVYQLLQHLLSVEMGAFYFELCKDRLYADGERSRKRRSVLTVLAAVLETMMKAIAPIMPHTAEDIYQHCNPQLQRIMNDTFAPAVPLPVDGLSSVFTHGWLSVLSPSSGMRQGIVSEAASEDMRRYGMVRRLRAEVNKLLEVARHVKKREEESGVEGVDDLRWQGEGSLSASEADVSLRLWFGSQLYDTVQLFEEGELSVIMGVSSVMAVNDGVRGLDEGGRLEPSALLVAGVATVETDNGQRERVGVVVRRTSGIKCNRCWRHTPSQRADTLCTRCVRVLAEMQHGV